MRKDNFTKLQKQLVKNFYTDRHGILLSDDEIVEICQNLISFAKAVILYSQQNREKRKGKSGK